MEGPTPGGQVLQSQAMRDKYSPTPYPVQVPGKICLISVDCKGLVVTLGSTELFKVSGVMEAAAGTGGVSLVP